jgi:hypothetical protein
MQWSEPTSRGQLSSTITHKNTEHETSTLFFDLIPSDEEYTLAAYETLKVSGASSSYQGRWVWDLGQFSQRKHARQFASYVLAGWLETGSFAHCPSVRHADELL